MSSTGSAADRGFQCNVCGAASPAPAQGFDRERASCAHCGSTVRLRGLVSLISMEIFGVPLTLDEMPVMKSLRGIGMSDPPPLAERLAEKFDYTNTFYHQAPRFDVVSMDERHLGQYDFIVSSEVLEHVPPPVGVAFRTLHRMLKPNGVLLLTTPYSLKPATAEHYPALYEFQVVQLGGRAVLVNRTREGRVEVFEDLVFHGGDGSTVEIREFTESSLLALLKDAGFEQVVIRGENVAAHGVVHGERWSLPVAARKGRFAPGLAEIAGAYRDRGAEVAALRAELARLADELTQTRATAAAIQERASAEVAETSRWAKKIESEFEERTRWAVQLQSEVKEQIGNVRHLQQEVEAQAARARDLEAELVRVRSRLWNRVGRLLRLGS